MMKRRYRSGAVGTLGLGLLALPMVAQTTTPAMTTLKAETSNNTSAADSFPGWMNGMSKGGNVSPVPIPSMLSTGTKTRYISHFMPNFSTACGAAEKCESHRLVGYESNSEEQVAKQLADMQRRGFTVVWMDWFGPESKHHDGVGIKMMHESEKMQKAGVEWNFVIQPDHGSTKGCSDEACTTKKLIEVLDYDYKTYEGSPAYLRWKGRPVVPFFWNSNSPVDWAEVKRKTPGNPLFVFLASAGFKNPEADGVFFWDKPEGPRDIGLHAMDEFYETAAQAKDKLIVGSAYAGFDDRMASWGKQKIIPQQCGMTWIQTMAESLKYEKDSGSPLPFLQVVTWNDYEEGTSVEPGIANCVEGIPAQVKDGKLSWSVVFGKDKDGATGNEATIAYYRVLASTEGDKLQPLRLVPTKEKHELDLTPFHLKSGQKVYVQAVGQSMIQNHLSDAVTAP